MGNLGDQGQRAAETGRRQVGAEVVSRSLERTSFSPFRFRIGFLWTQHAVQEATDTFMLQREELRMLRDNDSNTQDPNFIRWRKATTEVFRHFLPESELFVNFERIAFDSIKLESQIDGTRGPR